MVTGFKLLGIKKFKSRLENRLGCDLMVLLGYIPINTSKSHTNFSKFQSLHLNPSIPPCFKPATNLIYFPSLSFTNSFNFPHDVQR